ncbi:MAG: hypothetical protein EA409_03340 [Saprospirales bacterium]|nr:MAG: hypothetical protein EA409_03340 [Saprospirales bacterium]
MTKQSLYILIALLAAVLLVGVANLYFMLKNEEHIHAVSIEEEWNEELEGETTAVEALEQLPNGERGKKSSDRPTTGTMQQTAETQRPAEQRSTTEPAATPSRPSRSAEINVPQWVNRSIPLTFETRGGAADSIRKQYEHVVKDLQAAQQHLINGNAEAAMALIRPMLWDRSNIYREDAEWYQILANLSAGNNETATNQLNRLLRDNIHLYYFLGRELHAELVPIRELMQQQARREGRSSQDRTGY